MRRLPVIDDEKRLCGMISEADVATHVPHEAFAELIEAIASARAAALLRPALMWRCPTCGQTFVTRNLPHSCEVVALDDHFAGARTCGRSSTPTSRRRARA